MKRLKEPGPLFFLKREGHDRIMISGGWHGLWDPEANRGHTINAAIEGNVTEAIAIYPLLKDLRIEVSDANHLETFTPDKIPIIDRLRSVNNVWYATGWCGHGWAIAPVIAEDISKWMMVFCFRCSSKTHQADS